MKGFGAISFQEDYSLIMAGQAFFKSRAKFFVMCSGTKEKKTLHRKYSAK